MPVLPPVFLAIVALILVAKSVVIVRPGQGARPSQRATT
jgi:hypothetical protein